MPSGISGPKDLSRALISLPLSFRAKSKRFCFFMRLPFSTAMHQDEVDNQRSGIPPPPPSSPSGCRGPKDLSRALIVLPLSFRAKSKRFCFFMLLSFAAIIDGVIRKLRAIGFGQTGDLLAALSFREIEQVWTIEAARHDAEFAVIDPIEAFRAD
jgi:hypothetical protein